MVTKTYLPSYLCDSSDSSDSSDTCDSSDSRDSSDGSDSSDSSDSKDSSDQKTVFFTKTKTFFYNTKNSQKKLNKSNCVETQNSNCDKT